MWKYKITAVSEVNQSGNMEIVFDILRNDNPVFQSLRVTTTPDNYQKAIKQRAMDLKQQVLQRLEIQVGEEGEL